jgi:hypothetical protein
MNRAMLNVRSIQIALGAVVIALGLSAWTASRAIRIDQTPAAPPPSFATADALTRPPMVVPVDIGVVVGTNVFSPERKAPLRRYRLSGYAEPVASAPPPKPLVLGTVVAPNNRSFAFCRMPDGPAVIVRVGEKIGTYTVKSIDRNQVVFYAPGEEPFAVNASKQ